MSTRPPFTALHVFCTAARCGSFKLAAQALCVTPGAVSRQIQALEEHLGHALFDRGPPALRLTRKGELLHERVADKMASIAAELDFLRRGGRRALVRVDAGVTLAMHWLIPRLASFAKANPGIQVELGTTDGPIDTSRPIDVYIRRDAGEFRGREPEWFMQEYSVLVAASAGHGLDGVRLGARSRTDLWPRWSRYHRLPEAGCSPSLEFDNTVLAIQAAAEGLGVLVVPEMFVGGMLENQLLVRLDGSRVLTGAYGYVSGPGRSSAAARTFMAWLDGFGRDAELPVAAGSAQRRD